MTNILSAPLYLIAAGYVCPVALHNGRIRLWRSCKDALSEFLKQREGMHRNLDQRCQAPTPNVFPVYNGVQQTGVQ